MKLRCLGEFLSGLSVPDRAAFASESKTTLAYLNHLVRGSRAMTPRTAARMERASQGRLTRQLLMPHEWREIWPELDRGERELPAVQPGATAHPQEQAHVG